MKSYGREGLWVRRQRRKVEGDVGCEYSRGIGVDALGRTKGKGLCRVEENKIYYNK